MAKADLRAAALSARSAIAFQQSVNMADDPDSMWAEPLALLNAALDPEPTPAQLRAAGKPEEANQVVERLIYETAGRLVNDDVYLNLSWLVSELFKRAGERDSIMDDEEQAALAGRAPDDDDYREALPDGYTVESGIDPADGATAWRWFADDEDGAPAPEDSDWFETEGEALRDLFDSESPEEPDGSEAFEHWAVSHYLAERLREKGESVANTDWAGHVWARCTTGQAIRMDYVFQSIARDMLKREIEGGE